MKVEKVEKVEESKKLKKLNKLKVENVYDGASVVPRGYLFSISPGPDHIHLKVLKFLGYIISS